MSDADSMACPPPNILAADADGLTMWRAEFDGISVRRVFNGMHLEARRGDTHLSFTLTAAQARHLGALLHGHAEPAR